MADGTFEDDIAVKEKPKVDLGDILREMVTLERFCYSDMGTFGKLRYKNFECYTVERPWENNTPYVSCVPPGIYPIKPSRFNKGNYPCWELEQVPNRTLIKIHRANTYHDVQGCIGLGEKLGCLGDTWAILYSRKTHDEFMATMRRYEAHKSDHMYINIKNLDLGTWTTPSYATTA